MKYYQNKIMRSILKKLMEVIRMKNNEQDLDSLFQSLNSSKEHNEAQLNEEDLFKKLEKIELEEEKRDLEKRKEKLEKEKMETEIKRKEEEERKSEKEAGELNFFLENWRKEKKETLKDSFFNTPDFFIIITIVAAIAISAGTYALNIDAYLGLFIFLIFTIIEITFLTEK